MFFSLTKPFLFANCHPSKKLGVTVQSSHRDCRDWEIGVLAPFSKLHFKEMFSRPLRKTFPGL